MINTMDNPIIVPISTENLLFSFLFSNTVTSLASITFTMAIDINMLLKVELNESSDAITISVGIPTNNTALKYNNPLSFSKRHLPCSTI